MGKRVAYLVGLILFACCIQVHAAARHTSSPANTAYTDGVNAFQKGDYTHALNAFLRARAAGYTNARLTYSLAVTYYRLGRYTEAKLEFGLLLENSELGALCHYNLGLIAEAENNQTEALHEYRMAYDQAAQPRIRQLAAAEIARLTPEPLRVSPWFGYADMSAGYDDNVALAPQSASALSVAGTGSTLTTILAGGGRQLTGNYANGIVLSGSLYNTDYQRLSQYNERMLTLGGQWRQTHDDLSYQAGLSGSHIAVGGSTFESLVSAQFRIQKPLDNNNTLGAGYLYDHVSGSGLYDYLSGSQQRLFVEDRIKAPWFGLRIGFQHELNARTDFTSTTEFLSASPTRNRLYADFKLFPNQTLSWTAAVDYEKSNYSPADVLFDGTTTTIVNRSDTLSIVRLGAEYKLSPHWSATAEYRYLNNESNIAGYAYKSNLYTLSLNYLFY